MCIFGLCCRTQSCLHDGSRLHSHYSRGQVSLAQKTHAMTPPLPPLMWAGSGSSCFLQQYQQLFTLSYYCQRCVSGLHPCRKTHGSVSVLLRWRQPGPDEDVLSGLAAVLTTLLLNLVSICTHSSNFVLFQGRNKTTGNKSRPFICCSERLVVTQMLKPCGSTDLLTSPAGRSSWMVPLQGPV